MERLTDAQLTATLMARQGLLMPLRIGAAAAIRRLTPLQGQEPNAPYVALHARVAGFSHDRLQRALARRTVVKTTINRGTLHLVAAVDYPAYAQLWRQPFLRAWRARHPDADEEKILADLSTLLEKPRTAAEIREHGAALLPPETGERWEPLQVARVLLPLVQEPPAGFWGVRARPHFVLDRRPLPSPEDAAELVTARYLGAFGPASRHDIAVWLGVPQKDFEAGLARLDLRRLTAADGRELLDRRGTRVLRGDESLPVRLLARWDQALLAFADRTRIFPPEVDSGAITLSGAQTVLIDGRVSATWTCSTARDRAELVVEPLVEIPAGRLDEVRREATRTALTHLSDPAQGSATVHVRERATSRPTADQGRLSNT